jgi:DNA-binding response OmpR family regulator
MGQFRWVSAADIPEELDLRRQGWDLAPHDDAGEVGCVAIVDGAGLDSTRWLHLMSFTRHEDRRLMLVGGANTPDARAKLLAYGFGDAVGDETTLEELEARARRLADLASWVPRRRVMATLELDLLGREVRYAGKPLHLHPREFALLWRLTDTPDETVSRDTLIHDVWRLGFVPESNSIAVHMSRLRRKLEAVGLAGLVETVGAGYRLRCAILDPAMPAWLGGPASTTEPRARMS